MPHFIHKELAEGRWFTLSFAEQLANIGSEVGRVRKAQTSNTTVFQAAMDRTLDLFDLTLTDGRWRYRRNELARARELFCAAAVNDNRYGTTLGDLERYFLPFSMLVANTH